MTESRPWVMRHSEARRQAGQLVEESHSSWFGTFDVLQGPTETMAKIQSTMQRICQIHQCQPSDLIQLTILNWNAPCLIASSQQSTQANLMGALINGAGPGSLGLVMTPSHTYGRGKLYKQQELSHKLLVQNNLSIDGAFCHSNKEWTNGTKGRGFPNPHVLLTLVIPPRIMMI